VRNKAGWGDVLNDLWVYQPVAPLPKPSFRLTVSPNPINIVASGPDAGVATVSIGVLAAGGFDSPVALSAIAQTGADIEGSVSPVTISGAETSTLNIALTGLPTFFSSPQGIIITATSGDDSQSLWLLVDITQFDTNYQLDFSVPSGTYTTPQTVIIKPTKPTGADFIYYTTDGTTPTVSSAVYVNPLTIRSSSTLKAFVTSLFGSQSAVTTSTYSISSDEIAK